MGLLEKNIRLPAVKKVSLELVLPFDIQIIRENLKKRKLSDFDNLKWPEAVRTMYKNTEKADNELLHIISCCQKAREDFVIPFKDCLYNKLLGYPVNKNT